MHKRYYSYNITKENLIENISNHNKKEEENKNYYNNHNTFNLNRVKYSPSPLINHAKDLIIKKNIISPLKNNNFFVKTEIQNYNTGILNIRSESKKDLLKLPNLFSENEYTKLPNKGKIIINRNEINISPNKIRNNSPNVKGINKNEGNLDNIRRFNYPSSTQILQNRVLFFLIFFIDE